MRVFFLIRFVARKRLHVPRGPRRMGASGEAGWYMTTPRYQILRLKISLNRPSLGWTFRPFFFTGGLRPPDPPK